MSSTDNRYDVIIIGGGPAGLSAGIYTSRARLNSLLVEKGIIGGQIVNAELVENYPGFPEGISGYELTDSMHKQATNFGLKTVFAEATAIELKGEQKIVKTTEGDFTGRALIIANGTERVKLGVPGEDKFTGRGVSYCATCDAAFFKDQTVAIVGGGNAAITEAIHLTKFASKVIVIHRRKQLRTTAILQERAFAEPKIEFRWDSVVEEIEGGDFVKNVRLRDVDSGEKSTLEVAGVFISIGFSPNTDYLKGVLPLDERGVVVASADRGTDVPGVFVAGDICRRSIWQVIVAAGDGAVAAISAERFLAE
jgi:thioredoxin reductase (NADPH)